MLREATPAEVARLGRGPVAGLVELTSRCNLSCVHCYLNQAASSPAEEMPRGRLLRLFPEIAAAGGLFVTLSGGEPLLRGDFPDVYLASVEAGLVTSVYTNATLVSDRVADLLDEHRPEHVEVSVYGATRETYEAVTRRPGSYAAFVRGLDLLQEAGVPVRLKAMALRSTIAEFDEIARDRLAQMEGQRAELDVAISELRAQMAEAEKRIARQRDHQD